MKEPLHLKHLKINTMYKCRLSGRNVFIVMLPEQPTVDLKTVDDFEYMENAIGLVYNKQQGTLDNISIPNYLLEEL